MNKPSPVPSLRDLRAQEGGTQKVLGRIPEVPSGHVQALGGWFLEITEDFAERWETHFSSRV